MKLEDAKRISIVGNSGAGKSTLSNMLRKQLNKSVFTIDKIYWLPGWELRDRQSYKTLHDEWLSQKSWIIDGVGYWEELEQRLFTSDMVIFLDTPIRVCKEQALNRIEQEKSSRNPYITEGCLYGEVKEKQIDVIENFQSVLRPKIIALLEKVGLEKVKVTRIQIRSASSNKVEIGAS